MTEPDRLAPGGRAILSRTLTLAEVTREGRHVHIEATPEERAALCADLHAPEISALSADLLVRHWGKSGVEVTGRVTADVVQTCVVTLEPVPGHVDEPVEIRFETAPEVAALTARAEAEAADAEDDDSADVPDVFDGQTIPVGAVAEEFFALGLDPYPRKAGVEFTPESLGYSIGDPSPGAFAVLARLKDRREP